MENNQLSTLHGTYRERTEHKEDNNRVVWNSENVKDAALSIEKGTKIKYSPFWEWDIGWRKGNIVYEYAEEEIKELIKCKRDICYFAEKYCQLMTGNGYSNIKLRDYQRKMLKHFVNNDFSIVLAARQIGKSTTAAIFISWYSCFQTDKNILFTANKGETATEIIKKAREILYRLPFFLKPGLIKLNESTISMDNGVVLKSTTTTKRTSIGFTIHLLFMDEFAHVNPEVAEEFYENIIPTLSAPGLNGRCIITSTPNGFNLFKDLWDGANDREGTKGEGVNGYSPFRVDWWQVPGRTEEWKEKEIARLGSEERFNRQYGNAFVTSSSTLLSSESMKELNANSIEFVHKPVSGLEEKNINHVKLKWHPDIEPEDLYKDRRNFYFFSIDLAEGNGGDYSIVNIFKLDKIEKEKWDIIKKNVTGMNLHSFFKYKQIGLYRDNFTSLSDISKLVYYISTHHFDLEFVRLLIEYNTYGSEFMYRLKSEEKEYNKFDTGNIMSFAHTNKAKIKKKGLKIRKDNKPIIAADFKLELENLRMEVTEEKTVEEICQFGRNRKGNYEGMGKHDDIAMSCINMGAVYKTYYFTDIIEEYCDYLEEYEVKEIEDFIEDNTKEEFTEVDVLDGITPTSDSFYTNGSYNADNFF